MSPLLLIHMNESLLYISLVNTILFLLYTYLLGISILYITNIFSNLYSSQTFVTQPSKDLFKKYSTIYSLGDLTPNTFCVILLYPLTNIP